MVDRVSKFYAESKSSSPLEVLFVHVDTDLSPPAAADNSAGRGSPAERLLTRYAENFPNVKFEVVSLAKVLEVRTIDWASLPLWQAGVGHDGGGDDEGDPSLSLRRMFDALPSVTSKTDVLRQLVRHLLLHVATEGGYKALLLGHTTAALAALTLSEVANGRGFAVPWQVNDGSVKVCTYRTDGGGVESEREFAVWYPLREVYFSEVKAVVGFTPTLKELKLDDDAAGSSVVSHKDTSILEVMSRYFEGVEGAYSGIVANVVRTAGKLDRPTAQGQLCGLCGSVLDEHGDVRWAGDLGDEVSSDQSLSRARICYGCKRSVNG
ncbi:hypothetical protein N3K66_001053 [Trichothecium roseum]|uniref:Uncharacterized protein n=1 Tax=Trichothecium roseum TaxID=47278 RepID=A0ACC0VDP3_9HYPO|nr:hypothetical protein N3K66_001053 [Trichothecium roseum]